MARFYCYFLLVFTMMFPYIVGRRGFVPSHKDAVFNTFKNQCHKWYDSPTKNNIPLVVGRNRSLSLITANLTTTEDTGNCLANDASLEKSKNCTMQKKRAIIVVQCKAPYRVSIRIALGETKETDATQDGKWKPINSLLRQVFVTSMELQIQNFTRPLAVQVTCMHYNRPKRYESHFELIILDNGQMNIKFNPLMEKDVHLKMDNASSSHSLIACLPMFPFPSEKGWLHKAFPPTRLKNNYGYTLVYVFGWATLVFVISFIAFFKWKGHCIIGSCVIGGIRESESWQLESLQFSESNVTEESNCRHVMETAV